MWPSDANFLVLHPCLVWWNHGHYTILPSYSLCLQAAFFLIPNLFHSRLLFFFQYTLLPLLLFDSYLLSLLLLCWKSHLHRADLKAPHVLLQLGTFCQLQPTDRRGRGPLHSLFFSSHLSHWSVWLVCGKYRKGKELCLLQSAIGPSTPRIHRGNWERASIVICMV